MARPVLRRPRPPQRRSWLVTALAAAVTGTPAVASAVSVEPAGVWPLQPRPEVVRAFDPPDVRWGSGHRGVDLAGQVGQTVRSALPGTVSFAGRLAGRGVVVVDHGSTRATYEPVTAAVQPGDAVSGGDVLGTLAWFGTHCLPDACLHWGLLQGETYLDPLSLVGGPQPVRLLPIGGRPVASESSVLGSGGSGRPRPGVLPVVLAGPALVALAGVVVAAGGPTSPTLEGLVGSTGAD